MTDTLLEAPVTEAAPAPISKVAIVVSKGSLEGIEAHVFFTFFGMARVAGEHPCDGRAPACSFRVWGYGLSCSSSQLVRAVSHSCNATISPSYEPGTTRLGQTQVFRIGHRSKLRRCSTLM